jgi:signal peptidase II
VRRSEAWFTLGGGLLIGGALGNAVDRVRFGAVADFLNVTCCGLVNPYAFNVADIAIFAGALVLAFAPTPRTDAA